MMSLPGIAGVFAAIALMVVAGCGGNDGDGDVPGTTGTKYVSIGTAPQGGAFYLVGGGIASVLDKHGIGTDAGTTWEFNAEPTGGSRENIILLDRKKIEVAISNTAITYFAVRGEGEWEQPHDVRTVMTMFPNVAMFVVRDDSNIHTIADLKGKRATIGPDGAGFEYFVTPILEAHGLKFTDVEAVYSSQMEASDNMVSGRVDAAFLGGGVPTASITQAASATKIRMIETSPAETEALLERYPFYGRITIPANKYPDQTEPFNGLKCGAAHLIVRADADEQFVYDLTKAIYEHREELYAAHPALRSINDKNIAQPNGTDYHPGAIRFFREIGIWPEDKPVAEPTAGDGTDAAATPGAEG